MFRFGSDTVDPGCAGNPCPGIYRYTAGANPVSPEDKYTAWYLGALTILSGAMIVLWQSRISKQNVLTPTQES